MTNASKLLRVRISHRDMHVASRARVSGYTFEYELSEKTQRRFNCNTLRRRAFNECNECVFTFPVLSLSRVSHFFR